MSRFKKIELKIIDDFEIEESFKGTKKTYKIREKHYFGNLKEIQVTNLSFVETFDDSGNDEDVFKGACFSGSGRTDIEKFTNYIYDEPKVFYGFSLSAKVNVFIEERKEIETDTIGRFKVDTSEDITISLFVNPTVFRGLKDSYNAKNLKSARFLLNFEGLPGVYEGSDGTKLLLKDSVELKGEFSKEREGDAYFSRTTNKPRVFPKIERIEISSRETILYSADSRLEDEEILADYFGKDLSLAETLRIVDLRLRHFTRIIKPLFWTIIIVLFINGLITWLL